MSTRPADADDVITTFLALAVIAVIIFVCDSTRFSLLDKKLDAIQHRLDEIHSVLDLEEDDATLR